jgi:hypothetical protein
MIRIIKADDMRFVDSSKKTTTRSVRRVGTLETSRLGLSMALLLCLAPVLIAMTPPPEPSVAAVMEASNDGPTVITGDDRATHHEVAEEEAAGQPVNPPTVDVGMRLFRRTLTFNQDVLGNVPSYELPTAFSLTTGFAWFPISDMTTQVGGRLGIVGDFHYAPGISSTMGNMEEIGTDAWGMQVGVRFDFVSGKHLVAVGMGFGRDDFTVQDKSLNAVPGVSYEFFGIDVSGRVHLANPVTMIAKVGYQHLMSLGEIGSHRYFPHATGRGLNGSLGFSFELVRSLEVAATFDYHRYFLTMNPEVGDTYIAGGALDQRMGGNVSLSYHFEAE